MSLRYNGNPNFLIPVSTKRIPAIHVMKLSINVLLMFTLPIDNVVAGTRDTRYPTTPIMNAPSIMNKMPKLYLLIALLT